MAIKGGQRKKQKEPAHRLNELITGIPGNEVRLIGFDGEAAGIVTLDEANNLAEEANIVTFTIAKLLKDKSLAETEINI